MEDQEECRFFPVKTRAQRVAMMSPALGYDFRFESNATPFLDRMAVAESTRQEKLSRERKSDAYNNYPFKKQCPECTAPQSYDELIEQRTRCPNCAKEYCLPGIKWCDVKHDFFGRCAEEAYRRGYLPNENADLRATEPRNTSHNKPGRVHKQPEKSRHQPGGNRAKILGSHVHSSNY
jgi:hypothetical protein